MATSDSITERYQAYNEGLAAVDPQIKGVQNKLNDVISQELKDALAQRLAFLQERKNKLMAAQSTQDAAEAAVVALYADDEFPDMPDMEIPQVLIDELAREGAADDAAAAGFEVVARASSMNVSLGAPVDKPEGN